MANHLRDLLETIEHGEILFSTETAPSWHEFAPKIAIQKSKSAMCFDAGFHDSLIGLKVVPELARLPFRECWVEFETEVNFVGAILIEEDPGSIGGHVWTKDKATKDWMFRCAFLCDAAAKQTKFQAAKEESTLEQMTNVVAALRCFLSMLNCTNIRRVEHKPDAKLQKARAKRGKQPLFSYWTLELDLSRPESSESRGGTHASPRLHLRRGHAREYAPGKYTWVQPCVVGNKALGMIHKDYQVKS